jgi:ABC-2 type transport system permease protein
MKWWIFTKRCFKEVLRDPLTVVFGIGFPVVLLVLLSVMNLNIPKEAEMTLFKIENLAPGVMVFGFSFLALFGGLLLSTDRDTAFLTRLYTSPLRAVDFLVGYALPLVPIGFVQVICCIVVSFCFGLAPTAHLLTLFAFLLPVLLLFVGIGLLAGSLFNARQVGSLCGALLTNLSAWLSGTWFSLDLLGKGFRAVAYALPFANAVDAARAALAGDLALALRHVWIVLVYAIAVLTLAVVVFRRKMKE